MVNTTKMIDRTSRYTHFWMWVREPGLKDWRCINELPYRSLQEARQMKRRIKAVHPRLQVKIRQHTTSMKTVV